ncbi:Uncharacterised protein [Mycobacteroides abscessus subsp. bolletii]|uniref:hypothetical protein n=1 Tax=Mycobacteroides abscessus TaxID=36809 RepID=UPI0009D0312E|nr:hypothetical protein [Mycobacteroides abscessus]SKY97990.1 Uncharacterised protein [Mycobacteroides abscessus subsp. bolletii]
MATPNASDDQIRIPSGVDAVESRVRMLMAAGMFLDPPRLRAFLPGAPRWRVDTKVLPAELAAKVNAREAAFGKSPAPLMPGYREDPTLKMSRRAAVLLSGLVLLPFPLVGGLAAAVVTGSFAALVAFSPWPLAALAFLGNWVRKYFGPLALTRAEAKLARQHTMMISPSDPPFLIQRQEDALFVAAAEIIAAIRQSRAWTSKHSDLHRIQLDLDEEAYQITESCLNLAKLDDLIRDVKPSGMSHSTSRKELVSTVSEYETYYAQAKQAVINRIAALYAYRSKLAQIETLLDDIDKASTLAARYEDFTSTFTAIVRDDDAASHTHQLAAELADLKARLESELAFISGHIIDGPSLVAPLILAAAAPASLDAQTSPE